MRQQSFVSQWLHHIKYAYITELALKNSEAIKKWVIVSVICAFIWLLWLFGLQPEIQKVYPHERVSLLLPFAISLILIIGEVIALSGIYCLAHMGSYESAAAKKQTIDDVWQRICTPSNMMLINIHFVVGSIIFFGIVFWLFTKAANSLQKKE
ncbi:MAG: hypothetical protein ACPGO5_04855 [Patescibacteria group bacterium]